MDKRRLFLAIEIPPDVQKKLAKRLKSLKLKHVHYRPQQQWHITLKFFGLVAENDIPTLIREIEEKLMGTEPFSLGIKEPGAFPSAKRAKHLWMGLTGDIERLSKVADLFKEEHDKAFVPHITVGVPVHAPTVQEKQTDVDTFLGFELKKPFWLTPSEIVLFRSKLTHSNPVYTKVATFFLG